MQYNNVLKSILCVHILVFCSIMLASTNVLAIEDASHDSFSNHVDTYIFDTIKNNENDFSEPARALYHAVCEQLTVVDISQFNLDKDDVADYWNEALSFDPIVNESLGVVKYSRVFYNDKSLLRIIITYPTEDIGMFCQRYAAIQNAVSFYKEIIDTYSSDYDRARMLHNLMASYDSHDIQEFINTGFIDNDDSISYRSSDGTFASGLTEIEGELYYFDNQYKLKTGYRSISGKRYCFDPDQGGRSAEGVFSTGTYTFHFHGDGEVSKGLTSVGRELYCFHDTDGNALSGLRKVDGKKYYFDP